MAISNYRKLYFALILFVFSFVVSEKVLAKSSSACIIGDYPPFTGISLYLIHSQDYEYNRNVCCILDSTEIDSQGQFIFEINSIKPEYYQILNKSTGKIFFSFDIYLKPGDTLVIKFRIENSISNLSIDGNAAGNYAFLEKYWALQYKYNRDIDCNALEIDEFKQCIQNWKSEVTLQIDKNLPPSKEYEQYIRQLIHYQEATNYLKYLSLHDRKSDDFGGYLIPGDEYYSFIAPNDLSNPPYSFMPRYQDYIRFYLDDRVKRKIARIQSPVRDEDYLSIIAEVAKHSFSGEARDIAINIAALKFPLFLNDEALEILEDLSDFYSNNFSNHKNYEKFKIFSDYLMSLKSGSLAPKLNLPDAYGNSVDLADFKGKVVYLNFWGTWCQPCLDAIPEKDALIRRYEGKDVVFINIALETGDKEIQIWKNFLLRQDKGCLHKRIHQETHCYQEKYTLLQKDNFPTKKSSLLQFIGLRLIC
ncbi:MAG: TlpA disulfide reductase family protein [Bacteroidia bacterium]